MRRYKFILLGENQELKTKYLNLLCNSNIIDNRIVYSFDQFDIWNVPNTKYSTAYYTYADGALIMTPNSKDYINNVKRLCSEITPIVYVDLNSILDPIDSLLSQCRISAS